MAKPNYEQIFARKQSNEDRIKKLCPQAKHKSGIYVFHREENGFRHAYVGLATKSLLTRLAQHLEGHESHIDKSIRKYGLFNEEKILMDIKCQLFATALLKSAMRKNNTI